MIFGRNTTSNISKLLYVISRAVRRVKFETILKYHELYLCQISRTNYAIICLYYYPQRFCNFHMWVFQNKVKYPREIPLLDLRQSKCRNFSCSSINGQSIYSKMGKDNERATSSFGYISEAFKEVLKNSPCMCVCVI